MMIATFSSAHLAYAQAVPTDKNQLQQLDSLVEQWLSLTQQQQQMQQDAQQRQQFMQQGITLLQAEKKQLQQVLDRNTDQHNAVDEQRSALLAEQQQLEQQQTKADKYIKQLLQQVNAMQSQLPPPLQHQWQQELTNIDSDTDTSLQLQRALGLLTKLTEFQQRLSLEQMTLTTEAGQQVRVRQLYLGANQAWFASADGSYAGIGYPNSQGWQWQFDSKIDSSKVLAAIAMVEKQAEAKLISLPITLAEQTVGQPQ